MNRRPVLMSALLIAVTMIAGLAVRFAHLGLPAVVVKYGGSALWAAMIYWVVSSLPAPRRLLEAAVIAGIIATSVEFFKLYHAPGVEQFRSTLAGALLLGRVFSVWDIAVYWLAIALAAGIDLGLRRSHAASR